MPEKSPSNSYARMIGRLKHQVDIGEATLGMERGIVDSMALIHEFLNTLEKILDIMTPMARKKIDQYCAGLLFGNLGSRMLVRFANLMHGERDEHGRPVESAKEKLDRDKDIKNPFDLLKAAF